MHKLLFFFRNFDGSTLEGRGVGEGGGVLLQNAYDMFVQWWWFGGGGGGC